MRAGINDILIISTPQDIPRFEALLGDGSRFGVRFNYVVQPEPKGIAQAFLVGEEFIANDPVCLILGDNIFYGKMELNRIVNEFTSGAKVFKVVEITKQMQPSARGELEITDVNLEYLRRGELMVEQLERGIAWLDTGTHTSLLEASHFIGTLEVRQGLKIACLEEIGYKKGFIDQQKFEQVIKETPQSSYREYLEKVLGEVV
jgi:glucose-1-phosphate thymidylyltransferase